MESRPWKTGIALAITLAIAYAVCAAAYAAWPEGGITFLNAVFHGLDFRKLDAPSTFTFGMFVFPLVVFVAWGFAVGTLYAWIESRLDKS